jgi:hypothetical protein
LGFSGALAPGAMPKPEDIPGLYCSTGKATCRDLDGKQTCICPRCPVWDGYNLDEGVRMGYFCRDGQAK